MMKMRTMSMMCAAAALLIAGCARGQAPRNDAAPDNGTAVTVTAAKEEYFWRTVTKDGKKYVADKMGNEVLLKEYKRLIVISPGAVETLYLIGAEGTIAAIAESREGIFPYDKTKHLPTVGNPARPDLERVIALEGDLVLGSAMNSAFAAELNQRGHPALLHGADSIDDVFNDTLILGELTGKKDEAEKLVAEKRGRIAALRHELEKKPLELKGAFVYSASPLMAFTGGTLPGEILTLIGARNIAGKLSFTQPILTPEFLLLENPDFLFGAMSITKAEDLLRANEVIPKTRAGKEGHITIVPSSLFLRPSPRIVEGILELYETVRRIPPAESTKKEGGL